MSLLEARNLTKRFAGLVAVSDVSFDVREGEIVGLIGPNGAGKTTCFNMMSGELPPTAGSLTFRGAPVTALPPHRIARLGIARTFQHTSVFPAMSVAENIAAACYLQARSGALAALTRPARFRAEAAELKREADRIVALVGLERVHGVRADKLPFGLLRRLGIGIALATRPIVLLMDEPAAGLDQTESTEFAAMTRTIRNGGVTVLLIEHDMRVIMSLCDRLIVLDHGRKIAEGDVQTVRRHPAVIESYLGRQRAAGPGSDA